MVTLFWKYTCYGGIIRVLLVAVGFLMLLLILSGLIIRNPLRQRKLSDTGMLFSYVFLVLGVLSCGYNSVEMYEAIKSGIMRADVPVIRIASGLYVYATCSFLLSFVSVCLHFVSGKNDQRIGVNYKGSGDSVTGKPAKMAGE
jgi:hypothetical protein